MGYASKYPPVGPNNRVTPASGTVTYDFRADSGFGRGGHAGAVDQRQEGGAGILLGGDPRRGDGDGDGDEN